MKHKLNMLYPGSKMIKYALIMAAFALVLHLAGFQAASMIVGGISAFLFLLLLVLVKIELWQDKKLSDLHQKAIDIPSEINGYYECEYCGARFKMVSGVCSACSKSMKKN